MTQLYDRIGVGYRSLRRAEPRIAAAITRALGDASTVVNVGAGAGSYEPADRPVVAVEPSLEMIRQRRDGSAPVVRASATHLPFPAAAFDAALAVLTVHHWPDRARGLAPENTLAAFRVGASHGFRAFECDVKLSADGVPFLLHDATLQRTSSGRGVAGFGVPFSATARNRLNSQAGMRRQLSQNFGS